MHPARSVPVVGDSAPDYALSYGVLTDIEGVGGLRNGQPVQVGAWTVCAALSHGPMLDPSAATRKPRTPREKREAPASV